MPTPSTNPTPTLATSLAGLALPNPVLLAAGTAGTLDELSDVLDLSRIGAVVTKSITQQPRDGNSTWRILESRSGGGGMLNAIGLANIGIDRFVADVAPRIPFVPTRVIASIAGFSIDGYIAVAAQMDEIDGIDAVEINVSCPNVHGGVEFGSDPKLLAELVTALRPVLSRTRMLIKLSPISCGPVSLAEIARAAIEPGSRLSSGEGPGAPGGPNSRPGADALCISNTTPAMAIDVRTRRPRLSNITGGLSGPAIHPIAVKLVHDVHRAIAKATATPIVGIGGVLHWEDAAEFILAGASAVEMGTALFADPRSPLNVIRGLEKWVASQGVGSIADLVGAVKLD